MRETSIHASSRGAFCPSCERFIGPAAVCPYCDADSAKSPVMAALRPASLILALAGLGALHVFAVGREIPAVRLGDVTPMMNFACVRVAGTVQRTTRVFGTKDAPDGLSFLVSDGSGDVRVTADRDIARAVTDGNLVPRKGDDVEVIGALRCSAGRELTLRVQTLEHIKIRRRPGGDDGSGRSRRTSRTREARTAEP